MLGGHGGPTSVSGTRPHPAPLIWRQDRGSCSFLGLSWVEEFAVLFSISSGSALLCWDLSDFIFWFAPFELCGWGASTVACVAGLALDAVLAPDVFFLFVGFLGSSRFVF